MMKKFCTKHLATAVVLILALGSGPSAKARIRPAADASTIFVGDVEQLYSAVNDPGNAGAVIVLAAGTYALTATDALGVPRPNGGRLDLQFNMSLLGVEGDGGAVTIDASALPGSSFAFKVGRTGIIRTGRGKSTIAWLTVAGNPLAASAIGTDLVQTDPADPTATALQPAALRVAHVSAHDSARGVDVRNAAPDTSGRRIVAEIEDSEFSRGVEGIRVINFAQADRGEITVDLGRNYSHENVEGCIIENNRSNFASIAVRSYGDRFDDNGAGCEIGGALIASKTGTANANTTRFDAFGSQFTNNTRTEFFHTTGPDFASLGFGLLIAGAEVLSTGATNTASDDTVIVRLQDTAIAGNRDQVRAFGAWSDLNPPALAGTNDHALIQLRGTTAAVEVVAVDSRPPDPDGTNTVTVVRIR